MKENPFRALINRNFQMLTMFVPGGHSLRVWLHRRRGVKIGKDVFISYNVVLETGDYSGPLPKPLTIALTRTLPRAVPAMTMVQGNPAVPIATCGVPLLPDTPPKEFSGRLRPILPKKSWATVPIEDEKLKS